ncbi:MAG: hypothetical protein HZA53_01505 [Planctomycetes bacterium]|nr:hypothetical protein [Planctomycetota bacterium]
MTNTSSPRTLEELFEREERAALDGLARSAEAALADVKRITRVEERVRDHPWLALGAAAAIGYAAAPLLARAASTVLPFALKTLRKEPALAAVLQGLVKQAAGERSG